MSNGQSSGRIVDLTSLRRLAPSVLASLALGLVSSGLLTLFGMIASVDYSPRPNDRVESIALDKELSAVWRGTRSAFCDECVLRFCPYDLERCSDIVCRDYSNYIDMSEVSSFKAAPCPMPREWLRTVGWWRGPYSEYEIRVVGWPLRAAAFVNASYTYEMEGFSGDLERAGLPLEHGFRDLYPLDCLGKHVLIMAPRFFRLELVSGNILLHAGVWFIVLAGLKWGFVSLIRASRRSRGLCSHCGYPKQRDVSGCLPCSECGKR